MALFQKTGTRKMKGCFCYLSLLPLCISINVVADTVWYLELVNSSNQLIALSPTSHLSWQCEELCNTTTLPPGQIHIFKSTYQPGENDSPGQLSLSLNGDSLQFYIGSPPHTGTEVTLTHIYKNDSGCKPYKYAGISISDTSAADITINTGSPESCKGDGGTVWSRVSFQKNNQGNP